MKIKQSTIICPICKGPLIENEGSWLGEINGSGTVEIASVECLDCHQYFQYDTPIRLTGM
jgi:hypothetical protein